MQPGTNCMLVAFLVLGATERAWSQCSHLYCTVPAPSWGQILCSQKCHCSVPVALWYTSRLDSQTDSGCTSPLVPSHSKPPWKKEDTQNPCCSNGCFLPAGPPCQPWQSRLAASSAMARVLTNNTPDHYSISLN